MKLNNKMLTKCTLEKIQNRDGGTMSLKTKNAKKMKEGGKLKS
jgi:hypothetical protein